jgi:hypothetical protein
MSEENYQKFATQTMIEVAKLLITLASAFFAFSATLVSVLSNKGSVPIKTFWAILAAWVCLVASIGGGILALGGIATSAHNDRKFDVDAGVTCWSLRPQQILFMLAFIFVGWFATDNR